MRLDQTALVQAPVDDASSIDVDTSAAGRRTLIDDSADETDLIDSSATGQATRVPEIVSNIVEYLCNDYFSRTTDHLDRSRSYFGQRGPPNHAIHSCLRVNKMWSAEAITCFWRECKLSHTTGFFIEGPIITPILRLPIRAKCYVRHTKNFLWNKPLEGFQSRLDLVILAKLDFPVLETLRFDAVAFQQTRSLHKLESRAFLNLLRPSLKVLHFRDGMKGIKTQFPDEFFLKIATTCRNLREIYIASSTDMFEHVSEDTVVRMFENLPLLSVLYTGFALMNNMTARIVKAIALLNQLREFEFIEEWPEDNCYESINTGMEFESNYFPQLQCLETDAPTPSLRIILPHLKNLQVLYLCYDRNRSRQF